MLNGLIIHDKTYSVEDIHSCYSYVSFFLFRELKKFDNINWSEVHTFKANPPKEVYEKKYDFAILLNEIIEGKTLEDTKKAYHIVYSIENNIDMLFIYGCANQKLRDFKKPVIGLHTVEYTNFFLSKYHVPWCGDANYLYPEQEKDGFTYILLDHVPPEKGSVSYNNLTLYYEALRKIREKYPIKVRILNYSQDVAVDFNLDNFSIPESYLAAWPYVAKEFRKYHIYCVVKGETGGLSIVEASRCGATVIAPKKHVRELVTKQVSLVETKGFSVDDFYDAIKNAIESLDVNSNLEKIKDITWENSAKKIINVIETHMYFKDDYIKLYKFLNKPLINFLNLNNKKKIDFLLRKMMGLHIANMLRDFIIKTRYKIQK